TASARPTRRPSTGVISGTGLGTCIYSGAGDPFTVTGWGRAADDEVVSISLQLSLAPAATRTFRALKHRNFRPFCAGPLTSLVGTWMQRVAQAWLIYRLTGSAAQLGLMGFASQIPAFLLGPAGGLVADRYNRRRVMLISQAVMLVQAAALAALTLTGAVQ